MIPSLRMLLLRSGVLSLFHLGDFLLVCGLILIVRVKIFASQYIAEIQTLHVRPEYGLDASCRSHRPLLPKSVVVLHVSRHLVCRS